VSDSGTLSVCVGVVDVVVYSRLAVQAISSRYWVWLCLLHNSRKKKKINFKSSDNVDADVRAISAARDDGGRKVVVV
jgi:hypothetical protein